MDLIRSNDHVTFWKIGADQCDKSKMAGQVKNGEILSNEFTFYEKITDADLMLRASNDLKLSR